jgi:hypothetical protein
MAMEAARVCGFDAISARLKTKDPGDSPGSHLLKAAGADLPTCLGARFWIRQWIQADYVALVRVAPRRPRLEAW